MIPGRTNASRAALLCLLCASVSANAASGLLWGRVDGRKSDAKPEYVCIPAEDGEQWQCRGDTGQELVTDFDPESLGERPSAPVVAEDLAEAYFVPREQLPEQQANAMPAYCSGAYQEPEYPFPADTDSSRYPIVTEADEIEYALDREVILRGDVRFAQGNRSLVSEHAQLDNATREAVLVGGVRLQEPGVLLQGEQAVVNLNTKQSQLENAEFLILANEFRGKSEVLRQNEDGDLTMERNEFTRCEPGNNSWVLKAKSLEVKKGEVFGTARGAVLKMKNVPIFYAPYIKFPVSGERQSGFLFPNIGHSDEDGLDLTLPYYLNLAPNYDATLVPHYISERGVGLEAEFRHLSRRQELLVAGGYLPKDDLFNGTFDKDDFEELFPGQEFDPADRWLAAIEQRGQFGRVQSNVQFTSVSDREYFRDLGTDLAVSSQIDLERRGELLAQFGRLSTRLWAQDFQRLDEITVDPYARLPELNLNYTDWVGPLRYSLDVRGASFDRDTEGLNGLNAVTGERYHLEPRLSVPMSWPFGFLNITGGYSYTEYDLEQDRRAAGFQLVDDAPDRGVGFGFVDGGLFFERDLQFRDTALVQTLEPRLYYLYREFDDQSELPLFDTSRLTFSYLQLFRDNTFSGLDRLVDANQLSVGVTSRFLNANTGREYFSASIGQINYFEDRRVTLTGVQGIDERQSSSAVASELTTTLGGFWRLRGGVIWDPHDNQVDESSAHIQYRRNNSRIFNVGYRQRVDSDIRQTDVSLYWPVTKHWSVIGRWNYDLVSERTIEGFGGIEYNNCCWQVRLMARRFLESRSGTNFAEVKGDDGIFLQIVFKGLAGFGTKVESVLVRGIQGYRTEAQPGYANW